MRCIGSICTAGGDSATATATGAEGGRCDHRDRGRRAREDPDTDQTREQHRGASRGEPTPRQARRRAARDCRCAHRRRNACLRVMPESSRPSFVQRWNRRRSCRRRQCLHVDQVARIAAAIRAGHSAVLVSRRLGDSWGALPRARVIAQATTLSRPPIFVAGFLRVFTVFAQTGCGALPPSRRAGCRAAAEKPAKSSGAHRGAHRQLPR